MEKLCAVSLILSGITFLIFKDRSVRIFWTLIGVILILVGFVKAGQKSYKTGFIFLLFGVFLGLFCKSLEGLTFHFVSAFMTVGSVVEIILILKHGVSSVPVAVRLLLPEICTLFASVLLFVWQKNGDARAILWAGVGMLAAGILKTVNLFLEE